MEYNAVSMLHDIHQENAIYLMVRRLRTDVLLCVGNSMMGDDGAGPLWRKSAPPRRKVTGW